MKTTEARSKDGCEKGDRLPKPEGETPKKKRRAPDVPVEPTAKCNFLEFNGAQSSSSRPLPVNRFDPASPSTESLSSSNASDYSASSRSYTFSSLSGSIEIPNSAEDLSAKNTNDFRTFPGFKEEDESPHPVSPDSSRRAEVKEDVDRKPEPENLSKPMLNGDVASYVEKAVLASSKNSLESSSPSKSTENLSNIVLSHHPPRLTSFESSSILHHEGLAKTNSASPSESNLKPRYVTLDYVKSAAAEKCVRARSADEAGGSTSSLSSSFISSIDSEAGSAVESDVVDALYNKIKEASARHERRSSPARSLDVMQTGDITKDLFPLIFPGHSRGNEDRGGEDAPIDVSPFNSNHNNNNGRTSPNSIAKNVQSIFENVEIGSNFSSSPTLLDESFESSPKSSVVRKCKSCNGICVNLDQTQDEEILKAKRRFGQCRCDAFVAEEAIAEMDYCSCNLQAVPEEIKDYRSTLVKLSLESNTITELPQELFLCTNLEYLSVSDNDIASLPPELAVLVNLKHLDVSKNVIEDLPECIRFCRSLEILDTSVNPIEKLNEGFTQLVNLRELFMNDCFFDFLPACLGRMAQLCVLELRDNQLQILPKSIRRLTLLSRLDLGGNVFQQWPDVILKLTSLKELWLDCNELGEVPSEIGNLTQLTYLDLSRNFLESIPSQIGSLDQLTDLLLSENTLTTLPDSIGFLSRLTHLNLELNHILELPDCFGKLRSLQEADLSHNKLEALPSTVGRLKKLKTLLLDDNQLTALPDELGLCTELSILQLSRNRISVLPDTVGDLARLNVLNICQNKISFLPATLEKLTKLEALWISPNQSKPNVHLESGVDPESGCRILTNVLFPQEADGSSRVTRLLGVPDEDDDQAYANDAADDDDLDAYARRERGKTLVAFNIAATSYSDNVDTRYESNEDVALMELASSHSLNTGENGSRFEEEGENERAHTDTVAINDANTSPMLYNTTSIIMSFDEESSASESELSKREATGLVEPLLNEPMSVVLKEEDCKLEMSTALESSPELNLDPPDHVVSDRSKETLSEEEEMEQDVSIQSGGSLRAWSSRSNLPSALLEQTDEWNPDEERPSSPTGEHGSPLLTARLNRTEDSVEKTLLVLPSEKNDVDADDVTCHVSSSCDSPTSSSKTETDVDSMLPSKSYVLVGEEQSDTPTTSEYTVKADSVASYGDIPFMDDQDEPVVEVESVDGKSTKIDDISTKYKEVEDSADCVAAKPNLIEDATKRGDQIRSAQVSDVTESKTSSVTSSDCTPATDLDSGFGNDVESQESVTDTQEEFARHKASSTTKVVSSRPDDDLRHKNAPSVRRNGGWIALVGRELPSGMGQHPERNHASPPTTSTSLKHRTTEGTVSMNRYVPASTVDCTTVTYSHEYNRAKARSRGLDRPTLASTSKSSGVADHIRKFETLLENRAPPTNNNIGNSCSEKAKVSLSSKPFSTGARSLQTGARTTTSKPTAYATILNKEPRKSNETLHSRDGQSERSIKQREAVSLASKIQDLGHVGTPVPVQRLERERINASGEKAVDFDQIFQKRRVSSHAKKTKFEEALAATKHKHFIDKIEKMMQQQHQQQYQATVDLSKRQSRGSISSLASLPRITSPVPHQHHTTSGMEQMSTEHHLERGTSASSSRNAPVHSRLKEKFHPSLKHADQSDAAVARDRSGSSRSLGKRNSTQRSSLRSTAKTEAAAVASEEQKREKSLEEQLGKLLLDSNDRRSKSAPLAADSNKAVDSVAARNRSEAGSSKKASRPHDWKEQLLRYLEWKKQESGEIAGTESLGRCFPSRPPTNYAVDRGGPVYAHHPSAVLRPGPHHSTIGVNPAPEMRSSTRKPEQENNAGKFVRSTTSGHSKPSGRRSSGRYQRTRTPGPEVGSSEFRSSENVMRPRSAMDMPSQAFQQIDPSPKRNNEKQTIRTEKSNHSSFHPVAPPSYEDHILRRAHTVAAVWDKQNHHDYVNVEYVDQMRASIRGKSKDNSNRNHVTTQARHSNFPLRSTGSHDSVLHTKKEPTFPYYDGRREALPMKGAFSQDSVVAHAPHSSSAYRDHPMHPSDHRRRSHAQRHSTAGEPRHGGKQESVFGEANDFGKIPPPPKTSKRGQSSEGRQRKSTSGDFYAHPSLYPSNPPYHQQPMVDGYGQEEYPQSKAAAPGYADKEDESVTSAFRPYQQHPRPTHHHFNDPYRDHVAHDNHRHRRHHPPRNSDDPLENSYYKSAPRQPRNSYAARNPDPSLADDPHRYWRGPTDAGVELVTVTIRKNPTFGFHIMGGIDAGGNPYRPDDHGVFITYVTPGGSADGLVQPGDKILLVNGSDFVGIAHRRAVDLLRNAGLIAVLVVERLVGKPV